MTTATTAIRFITAALAASRVTRLITQDAITAPLRDALPGPKDGTAHVHIRLRRSTNARFSVPNPAYVPTCVYCSSIYAAAITAGLTAAATHRRSRTSRTARFLLTTLALSEAAILIHTHTTHPTPGGWER